jgi:hypothetical protein
MNKGTLSAIKGSNVAPRITGVVRSTAKVPETRLVAAAASALQSTQVSVGTDINALKVFFDVQGRGVVNFAALSAGTLSTSYRLVIEIDGIYVYDATVAATTSNDGIIGIGGGVYSSTAALASCVLQPIPFKNSLRILAGASTNSATHSCYLNAEIYA